MRAMDRINERLRIAQIREAIAHEHNAEDIWNKVHSIGTDMTKTSYYSHYQMFTRSLPALPINFTENRYVCGGVWWL